MFCVFHISPIWLKLAPRGQNLIGVSTWTSENKGAGEKRRRFMLVVCEGSQKGITDIKQESDSEADVCPSSALLEICNDLKAPSSTGTHLALEYVEMSQAGSALADVYPLSMITEMEEKRK